MNLRVDPTRRGIPIDTGIFVRALSADDKWVNIDISELDAASLLIWLKSRGGDNPLAENTVGILLNHGHLHKSKT